ncbi:MAG: metal-dependent hydrolase [Zestosphaera sp.]
MVDISIKWFGHAAFRIEMFGRTFLIDPWINNPVSPQKDVKGVCSDYVIVTHDHWDHIGDALEIMRNCPNAKAVAINELAIHITEELGSAERVIRGNVGGPMDLGAGFEAVLTPAYHSSSKGSPVGVVVGKMGYTIYHAGDTGLTYDMKLVGELYKPLIALLPIGGHFTMGPREAAYATTLIRPKYVIPMHYGTFPVLRGTPTEFRRYLHEFGSTSELIILNPGEETKISV